MINTLDKMANTPYIAFADDDADDQEMLADRFLEKHPGTLFKYFKDGQEIVRFLEKCPIPELPLIIILDYKMPLLTGAEVLKALRGDSRYDAIHKIVWSTSGNHQYVAECLQNGAEKYFTKPNDIHELDGIVIHISSLFQSPAADTHP
jgi:CheY-like chemotaxis protein